MHNVPHSNKISWKYWILFFLIITLFSAPALLFGIRDMQDGIVHLSWLKSVELAWAHGDYYPRWIYDQMNGLGAPVFYLYPPFTAFFLALVDVITAHHLRIDHVVGTGAWLLSIGSGLTFFLWSKQFSNNKIALVLSVFYAVAPYHLYIDYYMRGALGEYGAFLWIPLIFVGIRTILFNNILRGASFFFVGLVGLFYTHLLTALIIAPAVIIYAGILLFDRRACQSPMRAILTIATSGILALGAAALYIVPALTLMPLMNADALRLRAISDSFIFNLLSSHGDKFFIKVFAIAIIYFFVAAGCLLFWLASAKKETGTLIKKESFFWVAATIISVLVISGAAPFLFKAPFPYKEIQLAWRFLSLTEFSCITAILIFSSHLSSKIKLKKYFSGILLAAVFCIMALQLLNLYQMFRSENLAENGNLAKAIFTKSISPAEYLPKGMEKSAHLFEIFNLIKPLSEPDTIAFSDNSQTNVIQSIQDRDKFQVTVNSVSGGNVILRKFYFPGWIAIDDAGRVIPARSSGDDHLVEISVSAGRHIYTFQRDKLPPEIYGQTISIISICLFILFLFAFRLFLANKNSKLAV